VSGALVDAGPLVAAFHQDDPDHEASVDALRSVRGRLSAPWPVITEAHYLLEKVRPGAGERLLDAFARGAFRAVALDEGDLPPISDILRKYRDQRLQLADAALLHLSARDGFDAILTLDERDFRAVAAARRGRLKVVVCRRKP
jgi:predicted nucleic acid-binding protein